MRISTAQARAKRVTWGSQALGVRHFIVNQTFAQTGSSEDLFEFALQRPCMILYRFLTQDLVEILVRDPF